ncbi:MAG: hypothetical protein GY930_20795, partial [bacterium]|nr:hypothetical protein [bacterium]
MKISSSSSQAQAMQAQAMSQSKLQAPTDATSNGGTLSIQTGAGNAVTTGQLSLSPSERLERYAAHMEERLSLLESNAAESGLDLADVRSAFRDHITRLRDAMANGMQGEDLARGIENTSNLVRDGVREALGLVSMQGANETQSAGGSNASVGANAGPGGLSTTVEINHSTERLNAIEKNVMQRLEEMYSVSRGAETEVVHNAREQFNRHMERLRNALSTGHMTLEDMRRSMANIMQHLEDNLGGPTILASTAGEPGFTSGPGKSESSGVTAGNVNNGNVTKPSDAEMAPRQKALSLLGEDILSARNESFVSDLSNLVKPGSPVSDFLLEMRDATQKAKGSLHESYTQAALKASIISPDLPGS